MHPLDLKFLYIILDGHLLRFQCNLPQEKLSNSRDVNAATDKADKHTERISTIFFKQKYRP
jgi:hypothetical protein